MAAPKTTRIANDTTQAVPQTTSPGDAPADTYDPTERVSSVNPDKAAAAAAGHLNVNAVEPVDSIAPAAPATNRLQVVTAYSNTNSAVTLVLNYDKGVAVEPATHATSTAVEKGIFIIEGGNVWECTTAGTTAGTKPTFTGAVGATVTDGTVVWTRRS